MHAQAPACVVPKADGYGLSTIEAVIGVGCTDSVMEDLYRREWNVAQFRVGMQFFNDVRNQLLVVGRLGVDVRIAGVAETQTKVVTRRAPPRRWK